MRLTEVLQELQEERFKVWWEVRAWSSDDQQRFFARSAFLEFCAGIDRKNADKRALSELSGIIRQRSPRKVAVIEMRKPIKEGTTDE